MSLRIFTEAERLGRSGIPAALATVIETSGSVPRHAAAQMIVPAEGEPIGTIGGGKIELEVLQAGREVARGSPPVRLDKHLVHDLAMCCGGRMSIWIEPLDGSRWKPMGEAARRARERRRVALVTALSGVGGKDLALEVPDRAAVVGDRFIEPVLPIDRLVLFGAGHVAQALARVAGNLGFEIFVCDEDEAFANAERFPDATILSTFAVAEVERALGSLGPGDYAAILTRDHAVDQEILERILPRADALSYLGLIGSEGKVGRFKKRIEAKEVVPAEKLAHAWTKMRAPVGLDIGAETPEEIAVAIAAELIATRARGK